MCGGKKLFRIPFYPSPIPLSSSLDHILYPRGGGVENCSNTNKGGEKKENEDGRSIGKGKGGGVGESLREFRLKIRLAKYCSNLVFNFSILAGNHHNVIGGLKYCWNNKKIKK